MIEGQFGLWLGVGWWKVSESGKLGIVGIEYYNIPVEKKNEELEGGGYYCCDGSWPAGAYGQWRDVPVGSKQNVLQNLKPLIL